MHIIFRSLNIENFMSIGKVDIDFSNTKGFNLIQGINNQEFDNAKSNGSGKSSIFEALIWTLTGETLRGNKNVVNMNSIGGTKVKVSFTINKDEYEVIRSKDHKELKTNLIIIKNNKDISGKGIRDGEKILIENIPDLNTSLIGSVILLGQGLPIKFTSNSPSGRKEVIENLFKADFMIQDIKNKIKSRIQELNNELRIIEDNVLVINTNIDIKSKALRDSKDKLDELLNNEDLDIVINQLNSDLQLLSDKHEYYNKELSTKNKVAEDLKKSLSESKLHLSTKYDEVEKLYKDKLFSLHESISISETDLRYAKDELDKMLNIQDTCPTCGQKIPHVKKPDITTYQEKYNEIYKYICKLKDQYEELNNKQNEHKKQVRESFEIKINDSEELLHKTLKDIEQLVHEDKCICNDISTLQQKIEQKKKLKDIFDYENDALKHKIEEITKELTNLEEQKNTENIKLQEVDKRSNILSSFNTIVSRDFRGYLIKDIVTLIENQAKCYCKQVFNTDLIHFNIDGNNLYIGYNNKEYEALSGGERQKIDIIIQFAIRDTLCKHMSFSSNILIMDEIFDNLDDIGCQNILDLIINNLKDIEDIFIISHHSDELNIPYDNKITVIKENDGVSYINAL